MLSRTLVGMAYVGYVALMVLSVTVRSQAFLYGALAAVWCTAWGVVGVVRVGRRVRAFRLIAKNSLDR